MSPVARLAIDLVPQGQNLVGADYMGTMVATRHINGLGLGKLGRGKPMGEGGAKLLLQDRYHFLPAVIGGGHIDGTDLNVVE